MIEPFGAGSTLPTPDAESLYAAATALREDYVRYQASAWIAARARDWDSWAPLLERLRL